MRRHRPFDDATALVAAVTAALMLAAPHAVAQRGRECAAIESDSERLACYDCAGVAQDAERLACYDRALGAESQQPIVRAPQREPRRAVAPQAPAPAPASAPAEAAESRSPAVAATPGGARAADQSRGAQNTERQPVPIVVVGLRTLQGKSTFTTDSGEIWVQTDARPAVLPDPPFRAELQPGTMSSYFLVPADSRRAIRVRRTH